MSKFRIRVQTLGQTFEDLKSDWRDVEKGRKPSKLVAQQEPLIMVDHAMFAKIFSPERLKIIHAIQEKKPQSVSDLADLLKREQPNVHRDVHFLADLGILELTRIKSEGKAEVVRPDFRWDGFDIEMEKQSTNKSGGEAA